MPNPTLDLMADHRTVRDYRLEGLDRSSIETAVRAAQMASTSSHVQAYSVVRVTRPEAREQLAVLCGGQRQVARAGAFLVICGDIRRHKLISDRNERAHAQNLESFMVAVVDASLFAQNLALAFESMGLGICYIGSLRNDLDAVDALLGLPGGVLPLFGLCVGQPASIPEPKPRLPLDAVLFDDAYPDDDAMAALIDAYDATMRDYYDHRGAPGRDWSSGVWRKHEAGHRAHLAAYYRRKGAQIT